MANQVLILQLSRDFEANLFRGEMYESLRSAIASEFIRIEPNNATATIDLLSKPSKPQAVLVVDAGISRSEGKKVQKPLADYAQAGGTVVFGCLFSSCVRPNDAAAMFLEAFSLPWEFGDYHRSTFAVNEALKPAFGGQLFETMKKSYSMKAVHLKNVSMDSRLYVPTSSSRVESVVFRPVPVDIVQSPVVFAKYGEGYVGFIGDVNNEEATRTVTMAMLQAAMHGADAAVDNMLSSSMTGTSLNPAAEEFQPQTSRNTSERREETTNGCTVCGTATALKRCSGCQVKEYCSRECQRRDWKEHKKTCKKANRATRFGDIFTNQSKKEVFRNLVNVYRLHTEDTYVFSGELIGLYSNPDKAPKKHFDNFLSKAEKSGLLPSWWNATARNECFKFAMDPDGGSYIGHAVEKSDIQDEYGNTMMPMFLRMNAEQIYGRRVY